MKSGSGTSYLIVSKNAPQPSEISGIWNRDALTLPTLEQALNAVAVFAEDHPNFAWLHGFNGMPYSLILLADHLDNAFRLLAFYHRPKHFGNFTGRAASQVLILPQHHA